MPEVREALEQAFDKISAETPDTPDIGGTASTSAADTSTSEKVGGAASAAPVKEAPKAVAKTPGQAAKEAREAATPPPAKVVPPVQAKAQSSAVVPPEGTAAPADQPKTRAPGSWSPALREQWGTLPDAVRDQITKREAEITSQLTQSASARKLADEFVNTVRPYEQLIRASRSTPIAAVRNLLNTAATLQMGTTNQKVSVIAELIKSYGVGSKEGIELLDQMLSGQAKQAAGPEAMIEKILQQRLAPIQQMAERLQQSEHQSVQALADEASGELSQFAEGEGAEFLDDVREDMADLLEMAARRGRAMTLEEAYDVACSNHPEIREIREQRADAARIAQNGSPASRARIAAASLPAGSPPAGGTSPTGKGGSIRSAVEAAYDALSSR